MVRSVFTVGVLFLTILGLSGCFDTTLHLHIGNYTDEDLSIQVIIFNGNEEYVNETYAVESKSSVTRGENIDLPNGQYEIWALFNDKTIKNSFKVPHYDGISISINEDRQEIVFRISD